MRYRIFPPEELIEDALVRVPLSKSMATRTLILDALTPGAVTAEAVAGCCDDTAVIHRALAGYSAAPGGAHEFGLGHSGAALRFLTAFFAGREGACVMLGGSERLNRRPMAVLVEALRECGADIEYLGEEGFAPLRIKGKKLKGGKIRVDASVSSQFISALLMVAPGMEEGLELEFTCEPVSAPYIRMTVAMVAERGIAAACTPLSATVPGGVYAPVAAPQEGDWSAAAFWYEMAAVTAGWFTVADLNAESVQGDRRAAELFEALGVMTEPSEEHAGGTALVPSPEVYGRLDADLSDTPDLAPALVVTCCLIGVPFRFTGLATLTGKECDRLEALRCEMDKIGRVVAVERGNTLEWDGKSHPLAEFPVLDAHGDHRMAMALAATAAYLPGVTVEGAETVGKSYPGFWEELCRAGFTVEEANDA